MKLNTIDNMSSGALITNTLALCSFLASVLASPILTSGAANSLAAGANCRLGTCGLGSQCFKANSCYGVNLLVPNWTHCSICSCPGRGFGGRTDPTCIVDTECLNVQLGNRPDPCSHKGHQLGGRKVSPDPAPQRGDDGVIDPYAVDKIIPDNIPYSTAIANYIASLPEGSYIDPEILKRIKSIKDTLPESHVVNARSDLMNEFARLVDDGPGGPATPDAAMLERIRPISHPEKRGGCYTVENGVTVEKRGGCGNIENGIEIDGDINSDIDVDHYKRDDCYTVENGIVIEKRDGCRKVENGIVIDGGIDSNINSGVHKRDDDWENGININGDINSDIHGGVHKRGDDWGNGININGDIDSDIHSGVHKRDDRENGIDIDGDINSDIDVDILKRGGCYTVEDGVVVEKRGGCGTVETDIDIDVDLHTRGGCFTVENGVRVEKRGGCGTVEPDVEAAVEKRVGCFVKEDGVVYAKPNCYGPDHVGPPFPRDV